MKRCVNCKFYYAVKKTEWNSSYRKIILYCDPLRTIKHHLFGAEFDLDKLTICGEVCEYYKKKWWKFWIT